MCCACLMRCDVYVCVYASMRLCVYLQEEILDEVAENYFIGTIG